jgi:curved DNA-binding protein CbpA
MNMGVPFGSDFEITKKAYKKLIRKHHPDNNSKNQESLKKSTEKSKNLNISFQRIKAWELAQKG